jgi:hypothetical protein
VRPRYIFLGLCVLGLALPNAVFWPWLATHGLAPRVFLADLFANGVSSFFGLDVLCSAIVLIFFVELEGRRLGLRRRWLPIAATCLVGVSLGLPLFLYQRQVHLDQAAP